MFYESKKIVVIGGVAGGASAAARLRRIDEDAEIVMLERGPDVSFSNCGLPYYLSGIIKTKEELLLMCPKKFKSQYNIDARVNSEVITINREKKTVTVKSKDRGEYEEAYDKLIISTGADAIIPPIQGLDKIPHFTVKNAQDTSELHDYVNDKKNNVKNITVIGGGFIGIEVLENLKIAGFNMTLIEAQDQVLMQFDHDMVQIIHKELIDKGVNLILNDKVVSFSDKSVKLESGKEVSCDAVVLAIGVKPAIEFVKKAGIEIGSAGGIKTDGNFRTNDPDIYAVGDAIESYHTLLNKKVLLPLAGPAQKEARNAANHIYGRIIDNRGVIGSSVIQVFGCNGAATGLSERAIKDNKLNIEYDVAMIIPQDKVGILPGAHPHHFKLIFEKPTGRILGAQAIGKGNVEKRVDVIATVIKFGGNLRDVKDLELCYAPPFTTAKDPTNMAAYVGANLLVGAMKKVNYSEVRGLVEKGEVIIDVREENEHAKSHIKVAKNIPLSQIRDRLNEIPKDKTIYVHCRSGQRSYNAALILKHHGYDVYNIAGGYLGLSFYEYYLDKSQNRESILTGYNFD